MRPLGAKRGMISMEIAPKVMNADKEDRSSLASYG